jgi:hypothetical protein
MSNTRVIPAGGRALLRAPAEPGPRVSLCRFRLSFVEPTGCNSWVPGLARGLARDDNLCEPTS